jgi:hypothetical protein
MTTEPSLDPRWFCIEIYPVQLIDADGDSDRARAIADLERLGIVLIADHSQSKIYPLAKKSYNQR